MGTDGTLAGALRDKGMTLYPGNIYPLASACSSRPASNFHWVWVEGNLDELNLRTVGRSLQQDFTGDPFIKSLQLKQGVVFRRPALPNTPMESWGVRGGSQTCSGLLG